ncbi:ABC transporter ATP-binding protein [Candidatus Saccharibacteria bacterium]|nr:ABC transporter ATP-binding protein [Candidatus Saccharibacteria bacterium]
MADDIAIKVENVSKDFSYTRRKAVTVKSAFTSVFKRKAKDEKTVQHALKDISFDIKKGEFFGIVGRNGSGKSTLLKMLAGIYQPTKGNITVNGKLVPFIELGVGFNPELTGRENVYMNGALLGFSEKEVSRFYDEVVEFAELEQYMDKKLKNYSSGMQVRLAFSMAIRAKADILLIDEVLAVGDADFQRKCFNYFKQLKGLDTTVIFVSHDMTAVRQFCNRAMLINNGIIQNIGDADEVAFYYSKLFADDHDKRLLQSNKYSGKSDYIKKLTIDIGEYIALSGLICPIKDLQSPIFGFVVKDSSGTAILGSNTKMLSQRTGTLKKNSKHTFSWRFPNILSDGEYTIDLALVGEDGTSIIEWLEEIGRFVIKKTITSPYSVMPEITLKLTEKK